MEVSTNHSPAKEVDVNLSKSLNELQTTSSFWSPLKAIPLASFYKLHRAPSFTAMAEPELPGPNGVALSHSEPSVRSEPEEQVPPNGIHNKLLEQVIRTPGREPSPQPTHLSIPGPNHPRVLHEECPGYVAPKFEGKEQQMEEGTFLVAIVLFCRSNH
jgi:hypothetical protein